MAGIKTKKGAAVFEKLKKKHEEDLGKRKLVDDVLIHIRDQKVCQAWLQRQALLECGKSLAPIPLPSLGRRPAARLDLNGTPGVELLSLEERELCSSIRLLPQDYLNYKTTFIKENEKYGELRLAQARSLIRIDVNKTRKMYNFFVDKGWVLKPED
ncbi:transcriptional adapter 2-alpha [Exaiptasia diaphana]|uniref:SWIRM domain-containing protein n=1 Tax=Exaiptasia diaphana TaxID=2652724 RepID=A0A913X8C7_EXADI|nr:transcriptional adapter 2-alpha [Exaiptasia diaphana]